MKGVYKNLVFLFNGYLQNGQQSYFLGLASFRRSVEFVREMLTVL